MSSEKQEPVEQPADKEAQDLQALIDTLEAMIASIERLPTAAMVSFVTHYDLYTVLLMMLALSKKIKG